MNKTDFSVKDIHMNTFIDCYKTLVKKIILSVIPGLLLLMAPACDMDMGTDTLEVTLCSPANGATGVDRNTSVVIAFSSDVNATDAETLFSLKSSSGTIEGKFEWVSHGSFKFIPDESLEENGRYTITVPRSIRDSKGNTMGSDFLSDFYIGDDFINPVVLSSSPPSSTGMAITVPVTQNIVVNFSKSMNRSSVKKYFSVSPDVSCYITWSENIPGIADSRMTCNLIDPMQYGKLYTMKINAYAGDIAGNTLGKEYRVCFITGDDYTPPEIEGIYSSTSLMAEGTLNSGVSKNDSIRIDFSENMDRVSVENSFSIAPSVSGTFEWSGNSVWFRTVTPLNCETVYQVMIETGAKDVNGLSLRSDYSVQFKTDNSDSCLVKPGTVSGSSDGLAYTDMGNEWPGVIDMGEMSNTEFYIRVEFFSSLTPVVYAQMSQYSIFDNCIIETFKSSSGASVSSEAKILDISWETGSGAAIIKLGGMTNTATGDPAPLYRLTIAGGKNGVKDMNENYMAEDLVIDFRED